MEIKISKAVFEAVGEANWKSIDVDEGARMHWQKHFHVNLMKWPLPRTQRLREMLLPLKKTSPAMTRAVNQLLRDIDTWVTILERGDKATCVSAKAFNAQFIEIMRKIPGHRIYFKDEEKGVWFAYYVERTEYHPAVTHREKDEEDGGFNTWTTPAYVTVTCRYMELGERQTETFTMSQEAIVGKDPLAALAAVGWYVETPELREQYEAEMERYTSIAQKNGHQLLGTGECEVIERDADGGERSWWSSWYSNVRLDNDGEPARLVIDYIEADEDDDSRRRRRHYYGNRRHDVTAKPDFTWWARMSKARKLDTQAPEKVVSDEDEEDEDEDAIESNGQLTIGGASGDADEAAVAANVEYELPVHFTLTCFDLRRSARVKLHIGATQDYQYDTTLGERLILPNDVRELVGMLVNSRSAFKDAISNKGGGATILCAGPPGTGKTLTAEVYSEVMKKPLYSVQAAQLGIGEQTLEKNLLKVFKRSERWGAILLIDEADVYVMRRGDSVEQNAIVATFLRVLEYHQGILFFTTNRAELVDDAIASRCIARIDYRIPHPKDQARIWRVMANANEVEMSDDLINAIVEKHADLSGRDIKNVMKLTRLVSKTKKKAIDVEMIDFVRKFKPTGKVEGDVEETEGGGLVIEKAARAPRAMKD